MFLIPEDYDIIEINTQGVIKQYRKQKRQIFAELPSLEEYDMKIIDERLNFKISSFIEKEGVILCKFDFFRFILTKDYCLIFDALNPTEKIRIKAMVDNLQKAIRDDKNKALLIYVLEQILKYLNDHYSTQVSGISPRVATINDDIAQSKISQSIKNEIVTIKTRLLNLDFKIRNIKELLDDLYEKEKEELLEFCLTENQKEKEEQVEDLEDVIDTYRKYFEEAVDDISQMSSLLHLFLEIVSINVSETRNSIARFAIYLSLVNISIATANLVSSSFGMNLLSHFEDTTYAFYVAIFVMFLLMGITFYTGRHYYLAYTNYDLIHVNYFHEPIKYI